MTPVVEQIVIKMIQAQLYFGVSPWKVMERFGVSKTFMRKKCGWRPRDRDG